MYSDKDSSLPTLTSTRDKAYPGCTLIPAKEEFSETPKLCFKSIPVTATLDKIRALMHRNGMSELAETHILEPQATSAASVSDATTKAGRQEGRTHDGRLLSPEILLKTMNIAIYPANFVRTAEGQGA